MKRFSRRRWRSETTKTGGLEKIWWKKNCKKSRIWESTFRISHENLIFFTVPFERHAAQWESGILTIENKRQYRPFKTDNGRNFFLILVLYQPLKGMREKCVSTLKVCEKNLVAFLITVWKMSRNLKRWQIFFYNRIGTSIKFLQNGEKNQNLIVKDLLSILRVCYKTSSFLNTDQKIRFSQERFRRRRSNKYFLGRTKYLNAT